MEAYRAAVVGLSGIGTGKPATRQRYPVLGTEWPHSHVAAYAAYPRAQVVAACDIKPDVVERFRADWGSALPGLRTYLDHRELLEQERIDLLSVVTSDHRHAQIVLDAAERGVKAILCEKPLATTIGEIEQMIAACERNGVALSANHSRRWRPHWVSARALVGEGAPLGAVRRIAGASPSGSASAWAARPSATTPIRTTTTGGPRWAPRSCPSRGTPRRRTRRARPSSSAAVPEHETRSCWSIPATSPTRRSSARGPSTACTWRRRTPYRCRRRGAAMTVPSGGSARCVASAWTGSSSPVNGTCATSSANT